MPRRTTKNRTDNKSVTGSFQTIHKRESSHFAAAGSIRLTLIANAENFALLSYDVPNFAVTGLYLRSDAPQRVELSLEVDSRGQAVKRLEVGPTWTRLGIIVQLESVPGEVVAYLTFSHELDVWGANIGVVDATTFDYMSTFELFKATKQGKDQDFTWGEFVRELNASHLAPEAGYLRHDQPLVSAFDTDLSVQPTTGQTIELKYCSLCGRLLPVSMSKPGTLAFHKHSPTPSSPNSWPSRHQRECRACKKFRINNKLNAQRTSDQFHESSLIHRERAVFLREPQILQEFKQRYKKGLKQYIWEQFDKQCFRCGRILSLGEARIDHTRPFSYLWPLDEHATLLCQTHNGEKSDTFPVNFYQPQELERLSQITGLSLADLQYEGINPVALQDVVADIGRYSDGWDARTMKNINAKIREFHPDIDLYALYEQQTGEPYNASEHQDGDSQQPNVEA